MKTTAAVLVELGHPLELMELEIPPLSSGQVLVEVRYSGVCHTQLLESRGHRGADPYLPHCLGHEGSGVVLEVGPDVRRVKPGDSVIMSWLKSDGCDVVGIHYHSALGKINAGPVASFGRQAVVSENRLTPFPAGLDFAAAALLGCALPTGLGAVLHAARPQPGQSLAVFGVGGVGLAAILGARLCGCSPIVAVDRLPQKLELARRLGADVTVMAGEDLRPHCPGGLDFAIEASGSVAAMAHALSSVRPQGGVAVVLGNAHSGQMLQIDPKELNQGKQLRGSWGGDTLPARDFPRYARLLEHGRLPLDEWLAHQYSLEQVNQALDDLEGGQVLRPLLDMSR